MDTKLCVQRKGAELNVREWTLALYRKQAGRWQAGSGGHGEGVHVSLA